MAPHLVHPCTRYLASFREAIHEELGEAADVLELRGDYLNHMRSASRGRALSQGEVRRLELWLVNGARYLGRIQIRLAPSGSYHSIRSHIYYEIRPSERSKGFGRMLLRQGLLWADDLGLRTVLLACRSANTRSRRIIEENGGILVRQVRIPPENEEYLLYRITLKR